jgi:hypothetical protein
MSHDVALAGYSVPCRGFSEDFLVTAAYKAVIKIDSCLLDEDDDIGADELPLNEWCLTKDTEGNLGLVFITNREDDDPYLAVTLPMITKNGGDNDYITKPFLDFLQILRERDVMWSYEVTEQISFFAFVYYNGTDMPPIFSA